MNPRILVSAGLRSAPLNRPRTIAAFQRGATCAIATAVAAEAQNQRVSQRIKDRRTERFR